MQDLQRVCRALRRHDRRRVPEDRQGHSVSSGWRPAAMTAHNAYVAMMLWLIFNELVLLRPTGEGSQMNRPAARGMLLAGSMLGTRGHSVAEQSLLLVDAPFPHLGLSNSLLHVAAMGFRAF